MDINYEQHQDAEATLKDALRQMATHSHSEAARDIADRALAGLDIVDVIDATNVDDPYADRVTDAFVLATRAGVFHVRF